MKKFACLAAPLALAACTTSTPIAEEPSSASDLPTGATRSPSGFATIGKVPPADWPEDPPPPPASLDTFERRTSTGSEVDRARAWEDANGPEDFQREVERLMQLLPGAERGNFVELRLARDETVKTFPAPLLGAEVWFKRDAAATLAKYTRDPRFFAKTGGLTESEMETLRNPVQSQGAGAAPTGAFASAGLEAHAFSSVHCSGCWFWRAKSITWFTLVSATS